MVGLMRGFHVSFGDGLLVPFFDGGGDGVHGHDAAHQWWQDSCREVPDQDVRVRDVGECHMILKGRDVLRQ